MNDDAPSRVSLTNDSLRSVSRRQAIRMAAAVAGGGLLGSCTPTSVGPLGELNEGRLAARPLGTVTVSASPGTFEVPESDAVNHGLYFIPQSYTPARAIPLIVVFHGAGGQASSLLTPLSALADELGMAILSVKSRAITWDVIANGVYGLDVLFLDRALAGIFSRVRIDATRIGVAGFSDGASYSLSIGRVNGDLFSRIVAFSPGGIAAEGTATGKPGVFITHGTNDAVLPISLTKLNILPVLRAQGYAVEFREFAGTHQIPAALAREAMIWLSEAR